MKRFFFFLMVSALSLPVVLSAQKSSWRKTDDHWARKNSITFTTSVAGFAPNYNVSGNPSLNIEYDRTLPYNLSVSAIGQYGPLRTRATDIYTQSEYFWFAGAKVNYNLPVVRNWLYFRVGFGFGVGYHNITGRNMGECWNGGCGGTYDPTKTAPPVGEIVKLHFIADVYWVFRATQWLELRFAPLLVSPSQIVFGSKFNEPYNDERFYYSNLGGTLGVSVRF